MAEKVSTPVKAPEDSGKSSGKWKASNPQRYKESYSKDSPHYEDLSSGKSVTLDGNSKNFKNKIEQKIIVKE